MSTLLGDARSGKLADNLTAFGRTLRRAGLRVDAARIALAQQALQHTGVDRRGDVSAALEACWSAARGPRRVPRAVRRLLRDPELANNGAVHRAPRHGRAAAPAPARAWRWRRPAQQTPAPQATDKEFEYDAAMTASELARLKHADFNQLSASEYRLVERLVRDIRLPLPSVPARRVRAGVRGARLHWGRTLRDAARTGGELMTLRRLQRRRQPLPLLLLVDVSGSMERYARLLLAFLHAATRQIDGQRIRRDAFAFGMRLTDLTPAFREADTDAMLHVAGQAIDDFAGGTRLGDALATLRQRHARRLVGRRTLVLLVSDGLDTGEPEDLARELAWLKRHSRTLLWLNPLMRYDGYAPSARGAAVLHKAADGMLAVHNVSRLQDLATSIAALMKNG